MMRARVSGTGLDSCESLHGTACGKAFIVLDVGSIQLFVASVSPGMLFGRGMTSILAGEFRGDYFQGGTFDPVVVEVVVDTPWKAGRVCLVVGLPTMVIR